MHLKRIELIGFKSFADKTEFVFDKGITAVVGPNGSGKSNVSDAIKWVLGEQRIKSLRGAKMEDVIFSGTVSRRPLGYAEVTLVLDNEDQKLRLDYNEISVTRRLYRSGESEYFINKTSCRLKDIQELFNDTGLGREGYSIIGQGKIDSIISNNPQDMRHIFDEAAGIVTFKNRKVQSERKLEKTVDHLDRVTDIIAELEKQLGPLKRQKKKAQQYLELSEELKKIDLNIFVHKIEEINTRLEELQENKTNSLAQQEEMQKKRAKADEEYQTLRNRLYELDQITQANNESISRLIEKNETLHAEIRIKKEKIDSLHLEIEKTKESLQQREEELQKSLQDNRNRDEEIKKQEESIEEKRQQLASLRKEREETAKERQSLMDQSRALERSSQELEMEWAKLEQQMVHQNEILDSAQSTSTDLLEQEKKARDERDRTRSQLAEKRSLWDKQRALEEQSKEEYEKISRNFEEKSLLKEELEEIRNKLMFRIRALEDSYDEKGYYRSVKTVLKQKEQKDTLRKAVHDIVGNLMKVDPRYAIAIETALGGAFQNIVVEDEGTAQECIELLKRSKAGRATFLPLSKIRSRKPLVLPEKISKHSGFLDFAVNLIAFDDQYGEVFRSLLGNVLIVKDSQAGVALRKSGASGMKMVSLEGEVFFPGGAMVGGSFQKNNLLLQRKQEIHTSNQQLKQINKRRETLQSELQHLKSEMETAVERQQKNADGIRALAVDRKVLERQLQDQEKNLQEIEVRKKSLEEKIFNIRQSIEETKKQKDQLAEQKKSATDQAVQSKENRGQDRIEAYNRQVEKLDEKIQEKVIDLTKAETEVQTKQSWLEAKKEDADRLQGQIGQMKVQIEQMKTDAERLASEQEKMQEEFNRFKEKKTQLDGENAQKIREKEESNRRFDRIDETLKGYNHESMLLSEALNKIEMQLNKWTLEKEHLEETIYDDYEMNYLMAKPYRYDVENFQEELQRGKTLKKSITNLGNINVSAIEQYDEVYERHEFLVQQKADLMEAQEELKRLIKRISVDIESTFSQQFQLIQKEFNRTFKKLFNGGNAQLHLMDEENIMETGIEIVAQPPGKKLKNISLLSGGEKAMSAIALLFAIIKIKPAPFCVLDEIDAALDDSNVDRFAHFLEDVSKENQFVTITHRKGTMEIADKLYGVTMGRDGVSKMLSVQISEVLKEETADGNAIF
ncbi:MAG TPA: chromosome segregation protein SMC [Eubacteriaceae bacterium]|nr:chromosome segregation protein SMC [Eubacteriaceae bacterium]